MTNFFISKTQQDRFNQKRTQFICMQHNLYRDGITTRCYDKKSKLRNIIARDKILNLLEKKMLQRVTVPNYSRLNILQIQ